MGHWGKLIVGSVLSGLLMASPVLLLALCWVISQECFGGKQASKQIKLVDALGAEANAKVFFDIKVGSDEPERLEITLFSKVCPKTSENFRSLCTGEKGIGSSGKPLHYKGCKFHRIIPGFMAQGGDFTRSDGSGGESIYGKCFADEWDNGFVAHTGRGLLSMANKGPNTGSSQFFLTLESTPHLDQKHVVFGKVTKGTDVLEKLEMMGSGTGATRQPVVIAPSRLRDSAATAETVMSRWVVDRINTEFRIFSLKKKFRMLIRAEDFESRSEEMEASKQEFFDSLPEDELLPEEEALREALLAVMKASLRKGHQPTVSLAGSDDGVRDARKALFPETAKRSFQAWITKRIGQDVGIMPGTSDPYLYFMEDGPPEVAADGTVAPPAKRQRRS